MHRLQQAPVCQEGFAAALCLDCCTPSGLAARVCRALCKAVAVCKQAPVHGTCGCVPVGPRCPQDGLLWFRTPDNA